MAPGDTARLYHRLTSYSYVPDDEWPTPAGPAPVDDPLVLQDFVPLDLRRVPAPCKAYPPGLPVHELPRSWPPVDAPAIAVLAGGHAANPAILDLPGLARLLHLSAGVVRVSERAGRRWLFRAAGSAGVASRSRSTSPPAAWTASRTGFTGTTRSAMRSCRSGRRRTAGRPRWSSPASRGARAGSTRSAASATSTGTPARCSRRRSRWRSRPGSGRGCGRASRTPNCRRVVGADGVHEFPVALVGLGDGAPAIRPRGVAAPGAVADAPVEFPLITLAQHAATGTASAIPGPCRSPATPAARLDRPRRRHPPPRLDAHHGSGRVGDARGVRLDAGHRPAWHPRAALHRRPRRRGTGAGALSLAGPRSAVARWAAPR